MAKEGNSFYNKIAQTNVMPDAMLQGVSYGDFALLMTLKDKPQKVMAELEDNHSKELK